MVILQRNFIFIIIIILFTFYSCQRRDPLVFLPKTSQSICYIKNNTGNHKIQIDINTILEQSKDSTLLLSSIIPEIVEQEEYEIYFSNHNKNSYTLVIICRDFGKFLKKKMQIDKEIRDFDYKEIFNEKRSFISPFDANIILCSDQMEEVRSAIKRTKENSALSYTDFDNYFKKIDKESELWTVIFDSVKIRTMLEPFYENTKDSIFFTSVSDYKYLLFYKSSGANSFLLLESKEMESSKIKFYSDSIDKLKKNINFQQIRNKYRNFIFNDIEFKITNQKFQIIIR
jgi:hypothetical protein